MIIQLPDDAPRRAFVLMDRLHPPPTRLSRWLRRRTDEATDLLRLTLRLAAILAVALQTLAMLGVVHGHAVDWVRWLS